MNKSFSIYLDLLRAIAALLVVFYHYSNQVAVGAASHSFPKVGQEAVMTFFVLSGFLICHAAEKRKQTFVEFACKRAARIYSVAIPGILVSIACYYLAIHYGKAEFHSWSAGRDLLRESFLTGTFLNFNVFRERVVLPGGGPYWSLTYEVWYYALFAICFFWHRYLAMVTGLLISIFLGIGPILLMPIWFIGVGVHQFLKRFDVPGKIAAAGFWGSLLAIVVLVWSGIRCRLEYNGPPQWVFSPYYTNQFLYYYLVGACVACNIACASNHIQNTPPRLIEMVIKWVAGVSFSMYLFHLPLMVMLKSLIGDPVPYLIPLMVIMAICVIGKPIENSRKHYLRLFMACHNGVLKATKSARLVISNYLKQGA